MLEINFFSKKTNYSIYVNLIFAATLLINSTFKIVICLRRSFKIRTHSMHIDNNNNKHWQLDFCYLLLAKVLFCFFLSFCFYILSTSVKIAIVKLLLAFMLPSVCLSFWFLIYIHTYCKCILVYLCRNLWILISMTRLRIQFHLMLYVI